MNCGRCGLDRDLTIVHTDALSCDGWHTVDGITGLCDDCIKRLMHDNSMKLLGVKF